jgi:hypothetical protein
MAGTAAADRRYCITCKTPVSGASCTTCGHPAALAVFPLAGSDDWFGVVKDLFARLEPDSVPMVAWNIIRAPIKTILLLTSDPAYRGEWKLLVASLAVFFGLFDVLLPKLFARIQHQEFVADRWAGLSFEITTIAVIFVLAPVLYYLSRFLGRVRQLPRRYLRLVVLAFGYWYLLYAAISLLAIAGAGIAALVAVKAGSADGAAPQIMRATGAFYYAAGQTSVLWLFSSLHVAFWRMRWPVALGLGVVYIYLSQGVAWPLIEDAADWLDLPGLLKAVLG